MFKQVFILCTGRSGSKSIIDACQFIDNYSASHESNFKIYGPEKFEYPPHHIEADNRLSWFLGRLDERYGKVPFYVHLMRNKMDTTQSFNKRWFVGKSIIRTYCGGVLNQNFFFLSKKERLKICEDYYCTVNSNIELFLRDKPHKITVCIENIESDFKILWKKIGAEGNLEKAICSLKRKSNPTKNIHKWI